MGATDLDRPRRPASRGYFTSAVDGRSCEVADAVLVLRVRLRRGVAEERDDDLAAARSVHDADVVRYHGRAVAGLVAT
jgi:hypothetical protein